MLPFCVCVLLFSFQSMQITHKFACSICGRVYASQRSIKAHIKYHENLSFLQDKDGQNVEPFNVVEAEEGMWKKTYVVKFHKAVLCFCALDYEQDTDLYPDETAGETATRSTRVNTPRGINSTKGRSAAVLTDRSQRNPSPTECSLPRSVWGSQPLPRDNYGLSSNINEATTTSQEGNFSDPSTNAEQTTTMSESTNLERKESFDPNNFWDESYPSYHSSNNEDFFKHTYLHQPNEQIDPSYPLYIPQDGESNTGFGIFSELTQIRTDTAIVQ